MATESTSRLRGGAVAGCGRRFKLWLLRDVGRPKLRLLRGVGRCIVDWELPSYWWMDARGFRAGPEANCLGCWRVEVEARTLSNCEAEKEGREKLSSPDVLCNDGKLKYFLIDSPMLLPPDSVRLRTLVTKLSRRADL